MVESAFTLSVFLITKHILDLKAVFAGVSAVSLLLKDIGMCLSLLYFE